MKRKERGALKVIKKGFTIEQWESFELKIKKNEFVLEELVKNLANVKLEVIDNLCKLYPFILKHLPKNVQIELATRENFCYLCDDLQMNLIEKDNLKIKYASDDVQKKFITINPTKISFATFKVQRNLIDTNEFYLELASLDIQFEYAKKGIDKLCKCSNYVQCAFIKKNPNFYDKCCYEVRKKIISLPNLSPEEISIETLEFYLSNHHDSLSIEEVKKYQRMIEKSSREDKEQISEYINYLIVNIEKKKFF